MLEFYVRVIIQISLKQEERLMILKDSSVFLATKVQAQDPFPKMLKFMLLFTLLIQTSQQKSRALSTKIRFYHLKLPLLVK